MAKRTSMRGWFGKGRGKYRLKPKARNLIIRGLRVMAKEAVPNLEGNMHNLIDLLETSAGLSKGQRDRLGDLIFEITENRRKEEGIRNGVVGRVLGKGEKVGGLDFGAHSFNVAVFTNLAWMIENLPQGRRGLLARSKRFGHERFGFENAYYLVRVERLDTFRKRYYNEATNKFAFDEPFLRSIAGSLKIRGMDFDLIESAMYKRYGKTLELLRQYFMHHIKPIKK